MSYSGFGGGRMKSQVQITFRVRIFSWVLYYHRTATSVFVRKALKGADQSDIAKKKKKNLGRVKGNIVQHTKRPYRTKSRVK